jgi:hypothetical protein
MSKSRSLTLAEEEDRARQTVTKVVRAPEVQGYIEKLREEVIALGDEMVKSVRFALQHELDGRLAHQMLQDIGVIQPRAHMLWNSQVQPTEEHFEKLTEEWTRRLDLIALERSRVYGTKLPPALQALAGSRGLNIYAPNPRPTTSHVCNVVKSESDRGIEGKLAGIR